MQIYVDNAATTALSDTALAAMTGLMKQNSFTTGKKVLPKARSNTM